ncbi:hypothetical protein BGZ63DRAFT_402450 [Mariannaea sp. PMI_226]|nr:hypothetical protein BGZ63DRAFT_402450 [Mariannaea sp. PMI_226]
MARHHTAFAPHSRKLAHSSHSHRQRHTHNHHSDTASKAREKDSRKGSERESNFDWTDGILLALLGTLTLIDHDLKRSSRRTVGDGDKDSRKKGRQRSDVVDSDGGVDERYYEYGPKPGSREQIRTRRSTA